MTTTTLAQPIHWATPAPAATAPTCAERWPVAVAFVVTGIEALLTLLMLRALWRGLVRVFRWATRRGRPALPA